MNCRRKSPVHTFLKTGVRRLVWLIVFLSRTLDLGSFVAIDVAIDTVERMSRRPRREFSRRRRGRPLVLRGARHSTPPPHGGGSIPVWWWGGRVEGARGTRGGARFTRGPRGGGEGLLMRV